MTPYQKRALEQVRVWAVSGKAIHEKINNECTPDFACCAPSLFEKDAAKRMRQYREYAAEVGAPVPAG